ncbi:Putative 1-aminocyclopropane-1-carboxylate deaminase [Estrella lausannensis]|uniref:Putative 1-aminocyclopropane-1-carboxylate deaminase n=2 Tax=Estrella lausannensis TaxID=483423 RepID=A0A0H5DTF9_9BACT|nr:Putative 1-aminocyclopropane-1-carboxylate deaminase [Estrella lausannensis]
MNILNELTGKFPQEDYPKESRIHPIAGTHPVKGTWYIKREDELGFFTAGGKIRKWRTLVPSLVSKGVDTALLIGSSQSNNVLGLSLLLIEKGIRPLPILLNSKDPLPRGNRLFLELTVGSRQLLFVEREEWHRVEEIALSLQRKLSAEGCKAEVIPEGSYLTEAFFGALTLAADILRNEVERGCSFNHIFIEAGTGLQAIALILGLAAASHPGSVSVLLLADKEEIFLEKLEKWRLVLEEVSGIRLCSSSMHFSLFRPRTQKAFKPISGKGWEGLVSFAQSSGVWTDPVYSSRLFAEAFSEGKTKEMEGDILVIHSGGLSSLFGFEKELRACLPSCD